MPETQIFRKVSLERLSTPEQLDYLMQVTTPKGWYALWTLCGLIAIALIWSVVGSLPTTISGRAIIMPPRGVDDVYAPETGILQEVLVKEGDVVEAGQIVATLSQKEMQEKGTRSKAELQQRIAATEQRIGSLERQTQAKKEALAEGLIAPSDYETTSQALTTARADLGALKNQLELGGIELNRAAEVRAEKRGRIVEIISSVGTLVQKGEPLMTYVSRDEDLNAVAFIPNVGNQAKPGMRAEVSPSTVKKEEFGFMLGKVYFVSDFPARPSVLFDLTHNRILDDELAAGGAPYMLKIELEKNPKTFSGYRWSSGGGPEEHINAGAMCDVRVVVREQRPITLVIPALKSLMGL